LVGEHIQNPLNEAVVTQIAVLYEMGLPIVETGDRWHGNVAPKAPLNRDRDNVPPRY
jgi:hypothetical protein